MWKMHPNIFLFIPSHRLTFHVFTLYLLLNREGEINQGTEIYGN